MSKDNSVNTLNSYRTAAGLITRRLKWDLQLESWKSRRKLNLLRNTQLHKKAIILCNGPSLLHTDFQSLHKTYTFGLNKINLLFDKSDFRPDAIVAVNSHVLEQNADFYNSTDIPLFLDSSASQFVKSNETRAFLHSTGFPGFAEDCSISIFQGYTVTYVALQLAFHMGFSKVALVGCDHSFATKGRANRTVVSDKVDNSHFDPNYFAGGVKWQLPDLLQSETAYEMAKNAYEDAGRRIVNCTEGGKLEIFERESLSQFLESP